MRIAVKKIKSPKEIYKNFFLEKNYFLKFLNKTRLNYYYKPTITIKDFILLKSKKIGIFNINFLIITLKKMFKQIMQMTIFKGILVIGGIDSMFINMGRKLFYTFDKWHCGFITNFIKLMKLSVRNEMLKTKNAVPLRNGKLKKITLRNKKLKKIRQPPSYNISLKYQYYQLNEGRKLLMPQITAITRNQNININSTKILTINEQNFTKILLVYFIKECLLDVKKQIIKRLYLNKKNKRNVFFPKNKRRRMKGKTIYKTKYNL